MRSGVLSAIGGSTNMKLGAWDGVASHHGRLADPRCVSAPARCFGEAATNQVKAEVAHHLFLLDLHLLLVLLHERILQRHRAALETPGKRQRQHHQTKRDGHRVLTIL